MLFRDPKVCFIHIPKTGGSSIEYVFNRCAYFSGREDRMGQHARLQDAYEILGSELQDYTIFTVMRNTWFRIISLYLRCVNRKKFGEVGFHNTSFVNWPEFYINVQPYHKHCEDMFHYLSVDGEIPDNCHILDFSRLEEEIEIFWKTHVGDLTIQFPHKNINPLSSNDVINYLYMDPEFGKVIQEKYENEIKFMGYAYDAS